MRKKLLLLRATCILHTHRAHLALTVLDTQLQPSFLMYYMNNQRKRNSYLVRATVQGVIFGDKELEGF